MPHPFYQATNTQFFHNQNWGFTVSVEVPPKEAFEELLKLHTPKYLHLNVGMAKLHPKDRYTKAIGRDVAIKTNFRAKFNLNRVKFEKDVFIFELDSENHPMVDRVQIRLFQNARKAHLICAYRKY